MNTGGSSIVIQAMAQISAAGIGLSAARRESPWLPASEQPIVDLPQGLDLRPILGGKQTPEMRQQDALSLQTAACARLLFDPCNTMPDDIRRRAVFLGSAYGAIESENRHTRLLVQEGPDHASPTVFRNAISNAVLGHLAIACRFGGPSSLVLSGEVSGLYALGFASRCLLAGSADVAITGVTDLPSDLVKRRTLARWKSGRASATPLLSGSCLLLLRRREAADDAAWTVRGLAFGRICDGRDRNGLARTLSRALRAADMRLSDFELAMVHGRRGVRFCSGESVAESCLELVGQPTTAGPIACGTSVPLMINTCLALEALPRGEIPWVMGAEANGVGAPPPRGSLPARVPSATVGTPSAAAGSRFVAGEAPVSRLLVAGIDPSGSLAIAIFVHV